MLPARNGFPIPGEFDDVIARMLELLHALSQAGPPESLGDDDGGRLFNPRRNRTEYLSDPVALGAIIYGRPDFAPSATQTEEAIWLFGESALEMLHGRDQCRSLKSKSYESGGLYLIADRSHLRN